MEDWNMLAADCVVVSCCCQCLMLQLIIFILLKLPCKLFRKTKEYAKKKLLIRYRKKAAEKGIESVTNCRMRDELVELHEIRIQVEEFHGSYHGCGSCMKDIEGVLEELSQKGEFAFGSFWGREGSEGVVSKQEFDLSLVQFELVEIVHSFRYSN